MDSHCAFDFSFEAAQRLPAPVLFGTSTWTYPGWRGIVYHRPYGSDKQFRQESLQEYATFPWFRTVGIDSTFYAPPKADVLRRYASQLPDGFQWVSKVWERITIARFPNHPRYGVDAGTLNDDFLNHRLLTERVLSPYRLREVFPHTGPFVLQFPTMHKQVLSFDDFFLKLEVFCRHLPRDLRFAIEVRNSEFLRNEYFELLNAFGVTHCFNHWDSMCSLKAQMKAAAAAGGLQADFFVARLLTPSGCSYQDAVKAFQPYDSIKQPNPEMRADAVRLARRAIKRNCPAFIIVNNRAEGNAPMTIDAIGRRVVEGS